MASGGETAKNDSFSINFQFRRLASQQCQCIGGIQKGGGVTVRCYPVVENQDMKSLLVVGPGNGFCFPGGGKTITTSRKDKDTGTDFGILQKKGEETRAGFTGDFSLIPQSYLHRADDVFQVYSPPFFYLLDLWI
jgi:hypothetical protein